MASDSKSVKISWDWTDPSGKKGTTNITDVNPEATDNDLVDFSVLLNNLTGNTKTSFVTKTTSEQIYKDTE